MSVLPYPRQETTHTSRYSYEEICEVIDAWNKVDRRLNELLDTIEDIPESLEKQINTLEDISYNDGQWHRAGSPERYPLGVWNKTIKQFERAIKKLEAL